VWREGGAEAGQLQRRVDEPLVRRAGAQYSAAGAGAGAHRHSLSSWYSTVVVPAKDERGEARTRGRGAFPFSPPNKPLRTDLNAALFLFEESRATCFLW
jgi:hypothetical protein